LPGAIITLPLASSLNLKKPGPAPLAFVPLHNHSDYSLLDGASQLPQMVERAVELGMPALALTDHGVMYGAIELLKLCAKAGIKPIIGNEMYVINGSIEIRSPKKNAATTW